jgi:ABC-type multidrug transport system fused ATPase/permease subunit
MILWYITNAIQGQTMVATPSDYSDTFLRPSFSGSCQRLPSQCVLLIIYGRHVFSAYILHQTELLDRFTSKDTDEFVEILTEEDSCIKDGLVGFRNATFSWSGVSDGSVTPSSRNFILRIEEQVLFKKGQINLIIGPTGSGKTSLLMALLGL